MFFLSLVPSGLILLAAHAAARPAPYPVRWGHFVCAGLLFAVAPGLCLFFLAVTLLLFVYLAVALAVWRFTRRRVRAFLPYSLAAVLLAYGYASWGAWDRYDSAVALRDRYPLESMGGRVPEPRGGDAAPGREAAGRLDAFQKEADAGWWFLGRVYTLKALHERTTEVFVNSPGFGVARMVPFPAEKELERNTTPRPDPPPQPESPGPLWPAGATHDQLKADTRAAFDSMHFNGLLDFVNPEGWGYQRAPRLAAGFRPHAFSQVPAAKAWKVQTVELVGLLRHPEPVVYPSDRLPAMADRVGAPTRPLDAFEAAGLAAIRRGDDGYAAARGADVRFVGAVRSATACVGCHGGAGGDLLGAFSYRLRPE